jgi:hypothetical protein
MVWCKWLIYGGIQPLLIIAIIYLFGRKYLSSYLDQKGENLAKKEDIEELTKLVKKTEAKINQKLFISKERYLKEYELLRELSSKLFDFHETYSTFYFKVLTKGENTDISKHIDGFNKEFSLFVSFIFKNKSFYPNNIFDLANKIQKLISDNCLDNIFEILEKGQLTKENMFKPKEISEIQEQIDEEIRKRIEYWEDFDENINKNLQD